MTFFAAHLRCKRRHKQTALHEHRRQSVHWPCIMPTFAPRLPAQKPTVVTGHGSQSTSICSKYVPLRISMLSGFSVVGLSPESRSRACSGLRGRGEGLLRGRKQFCSGHGTELCGTALRVQQIVGHQAAAHRLQSLLEGHGGPSTPARWQSHRGEDNSVSYGLVAVEVRKPRGRRPAAVCCSGGGGEAGEQGVAAISPPESGGHIERRVARD